jgi:hypothetical protein
VFGPPVAIGEVVIGICVILGLFTGIMAFLRAVLNFSFIFAGTAGVNPAMIIVSLFLILAWRNAGWYGLDRFVRRRAPGPGPAPPQPLQVVGTRLGGRVAALRWADDQEEEKRPWSSGRSAGSRCRRSGSGAWG